MSDDPRAMAEAEHEAWAETPEGMRALVRLAYLGANLEPVLAPLRTRNAHYVERILSVPPAPDRDYSHLYAPPAPGVIERLDEAKRDNARELRNYQARRPRSRSEPSLLGVDANARRRVRDSVNQARVARWMEGKEPFTPEVMGWSRDDPRAEGWEDGRFD